MLAAEPRSFGRICPPGRRARRAYVAEVEAIEPRHLLAPAAATGLDVLKPVDRADQRYPYAAIVRIEARFGNGEVHRGTGFLVGPFHVLTAAHVLEGPGEPTRVTVAPGQDGRAPSPTWKTATVLDAHSLREPGSLRSARDDVALLAIDRDIGHYTGWFRIAQAGEGIAAAYANAKATVYTAGYPASVPRYRNTEGQMFQAKTRIATTAGRPAVGRGLMTIMAPTRPGQSGSPVWSIGARPPGQPTAQRVALGVVSAEKGVASLLDDAKRFQLVLWILDDTEKAIFGEFKIKGLFGLADPDFPPNPRLAHPVIITPN